MIALVVAAVVVVGALAVWKLFPKDDTSRVSVNEAVAEFREVGGAAGGEGVLFERQPGVYRYQTKGSESADTGLLSTTHDYDGISTITLSKRSVGTSTGSSNAGRSSAAVGPNSRPARPRAVTSSN